MRRRFINSNKAFDYSNYMTIEVLEDGYEVYFDRDVEYNLNGNKWMRLKVGLVSPSLKKGDLLSLRCSLTPSEEFGRFYSNDKAINLRGNILSLIFKDGINLDISRYHSVFGGTFARNNIVSVEKNFLPATTLAPRCYSSMFYDCTNLTTVPELPATTLANSCYLSMFYGCKNLTTAPALPATTLADACYSSMFSGCSSLTTAPTLPATTLANSCYQGMFYSCKNLVTAPALPATTLASDCYNSMFDNCTSLTTVPELPATRLASGCYEEMFRGCTNLTTAPSLPATALQWNCYRNMFQGCTSLTQAPELPATTLTVDCYKYMFAYCSKLNYIKMLATNISASDCLYGWVNGVASSGTFVKNPDATWEVYGVDGIPSGWTVVNDGEESDKIVNKVQLVEGSIEWELMFDYPINSSLQVKFADGYVVGLFKGKQKYSTGYPKFNKPTIVGIDPLEDDKYIYTW
jgi:hypothetical protein